MVKLKSKKMKIGVLAGQSGVSRDTVRLYEKLGLLINISRPYEFNNYKDYDQKNVERIPMVKQLQTMGLTLRECKEMLLAMDKGEFDRESGRELIQSKITQIEAKIAELEKTKGILLKSIYECPKGEKDLREKISPLD